MAKKQKKKNSPKSTRRRSGVEAEQLPSLPDRRAMEGVMHQMFPGASGRHSQVESAQAIMYQAFDAESPSRKVALARQAIEVSPDCADAFVLLAEHAATLPEALALYEQALAAGERALGEAGFEEYAGHFWGFLPTRPYMRARQGLAECLWAIGRHTEAIAHCQALLGLNPNDNQGIRYRLANMLLETERHDELAALLRQFDDDAMAAWVYTKALLAFRLGGDCDHARRLLREAQKINAHVPAYLTGAEPLPRELPDRYSWGGDDEAILYVSYHLPAWRNTAGAISWLRSTLNVPLPDPPKKRRPPWPRLRALLCQLPQAETDVWEVDLRAVEMPSTGGRSRQADRGLSSS